MTSILKALNPLLAVLTERQKEVIIGRFGLDKSGAPETLASIGERLNVTRERIRQIEHSAMGLVSKEVKNSPACLAILNNAKKLLKNAGGVMQRDALVTKLSSLSVGLTENHLALLLEASQEFHFHLEDEDTLAFYYLGKNELKAATDFLESWMRFLDEQKEKVLAGSYKSHLKEFVKKKGVLPAHAEQILAVSKKIHSNAYGDIGLGTWPEIRPFTTRDRAYLVLKKQRAPLHFVAIADAINDAKLSAQVALAPTVHNELIKDDRFVLVGRGMYALREHGFEPGIARDVIKKVLLAKGPLHFDTVVAEMKKQRTFKANTIAINLQNKDYFERLADGKYKVRES